MLRSGGAKEEEEEAEEETPGGEVPLDPILDHLHAAQ